MNKNSIIFNTEKGLQSKIILLPILLFVLFFSSFVSAATSKTFEANEPKTSEVSKDVPSQFKTNYGTYTIEKGYWFDVFNWFKQETLMEIDLEENTEVCSDDCMAIGNVNNLKEGKIFDSIKFKRSFDDGLTFVDWDGFTNWNLYIEEDVERFETICDEIINEGQKKTGNETNQTSYDCHEESLGLFKEWKIYDFDKDYSIGNYKYKLTGSKKSQVVYDWILVSDKQELDNWAIWGSIGDGDEAEVILNSPLNNSIAMVNPVTFNATANVAGEASLKNVSLCSNISGSWSCGDTIKVEPDIKEGLVSYWKFDEISGTTAYDSIGADNGAIFGGGVGAAGKIENAVYVGSSNANVAISSTYYSNYILASGASNNKNHFSWFDGTTWHKDTTTTLASNSWYHVALTTQGSSTKLYVNSQLSSSWSSVSKPAGTIIGWFKIKDVSIDGSTLVQFHSGVSVIGLSTSSNNAVTVDEVGIFNRVLTPEEITELYNGGNGARPFGSGNTTFTWNKTITGTTLWNVLACDSDGDCGMAPQNYTVKLDDVPPTIEQAELNVSTIYNVGDKIKLTTNITDINLAYCWYNYNDVNTTIAGCKSGLINQTNITTIAGQTDIRVWANDSLGNINHSELLSFEYDTSPPTILVLEGNGTQTYGNLITNHTLNYTITDTNLESCWINYNSTNTTIDCTSGETNSTNFTLQYGLYNATLWANDSLGNTNSRFVEWAYDVFESIRSFNSITHSRATENYTLNISLASGLELNEANLIYGNLTIPTSIFSYGNNRSIVVSEYETPSYTSNTNVSFYWDLFINGDTIKTYNRTQLVQAVLIDNCSTYTNKLFNISLFDENKVTLINGDIEIDYVLLNKKTYNTINSLNYKITNKNSSAICSGINLSGEDVLYSAVIRYSSNGYVPELYHIQRADIGYSEQTLNLYDLNTSQSTEFKMIYQDDSYNFVEEAVIQLQRKYLSEGIYRIVEAPLTSNEGTALVHIDLDSNKYRATVVKNGVVLDEFDNLVFNCESPLVGECTQQLLGTINPQNSLTLETITDFSYTDPVISNETISVSFSVPSGAPATIGISLVQKDMFGNKSLCNKTIVSSAGSISCEYDKTIGTSYIDLVATKNGELILEYSYIVPEEDPMDFLGNNFIIVLVLLLSLVGMAITSPEWIIINGVLTFVIAGSLWLLRGLDFAVGLGILMWLLIAAAIIIFKQAKQEDR